MVFRNRTEEFSYKSYPCKRTPFEEIVLIGVVRVSFDLERIVSIRDVVTMSFCAAHQVESTVKQPMEDEQHLHLLPEVNFFMTDQLCLVSWLAGNPDKNEKRKAGVIIEYFFPGIDLIRQHTC